MKKKTNSECKLMWKLVKKNRKNTHTNALHILQSIVSLKFVSIKFNLQIQNVEF